MKEIKNKIRQFSINIKEHGEVRWRERCISPFDIERIVYEWNIIEEYSDGVVILWGKTDNSRIIHVVCEINEFAKIIDVITTYPPDERFTPESNYRERRKNK